MQDAFVYHARERLAISSALAFLETMALFGALNFLAFPIWVDGNPPIVLTSSAAAHK
jgi:hypothetical protein